MNCNNQTGIYGFHPQGANIVMADGAVRFVRSDIDIRLMYAIVSRNGGEIISYADF